MTLSTLPIETKFLLTFGEVKILIKVSLISIRIENLCRPEDACRAKELS
jgi:hypothetical protein